MVRDERWNAQKILMALTTNLVAYYKLDESSGNATDSVGGFTLTNNGTTGYVASKINNGADGGASNSSKYLSVNNNLGIDGGNMSYSVWVNVTTQLSGANETQTICSLGSDTTDVTYHLNYMTESSVKKIGFNRLKNGIADGYLYYNTTLTTSTWYHIVVTYDGTNSRIYVDGTLVAGPTAFSGSGTGTTTNRFFILNNTQTTTSYFSGKVDEVGVWSKALSQSEVTELYNSGAGLAYPFATDVTVSATVLSSTFSIPAPTVTAVRNVTVSSSVVSATFSTLTATVSGDASISPAAQSATFSIPTPSVVVDGNITVSASVVSGTFSIPSPTVTAVSNVTVSATVLTATFTTQTPTVTAERSVIIIASVVSATFSVLLPTRIGGLWAAQPRVNGDADWTPQPRTSG